MSKKLIISLFIFSVFVPYVAHVSHIFLHSHQHDNTHQHDHNHQHDHTHHEHFQNGINEMDEDCVLCLILSNPLNHFLISYAFILIIASYNSKILFENINLKFSKQYLIYLRGPPSI